MKAEPKTKSKATTKATSSAAGGAIDLYLAGLPAAQRAALEKLRRTIRSAARGAEECLSYRLPAFRLDGRVLVLFGASADHCSFYPGSGTAVEAHQAALKGYGTSKGAIRFQPEKPLPASLVEKLVKYRIAENAARGRTRAAGATGARRRADRRS
jgi:uncharacterized protein YdhG (YjbR/CyaY superfamily)